MKEILPLLGSGLIGFILGYFSHRLSVRVERQNRRSEFRGFMEQWRLKIVRPPEGTRLTEYKAGVFAFASWAERIKRDLPTETRPAFAVNVEALKGLRESEINNGKDDKPGLDIVTEHIDAVTTLVP